MTLLNIRDLHASIEDKQVLRGVNLKIKAGESHVLMGANGSGKSSLASVLLGDTRYSVGRSSTVQFERKNLLKLSSDARARLGLYVAWQSPITIPGVSVFSLCKVSYEAMGHTISQLTEFKKQLEALAVRVGLTKKHISRNVNEGFSGGERKRLELLQLLLLKPKLVVLDEIDSGLDAGGIKVVAGIMKEMKATGTSFMLITHSKRLLDEIVVDSTWEMKHGKISAGI